MAQWMRIVTTDMLYQPMTRATEAYRAVSFRVLSKTKEPMEPLCYGRWVSKGVVSAVALSKSLHGESSGVRGRGVRTYIIRPAGPRSLA